MRSAPQTLVRLTVAIALVLASLAGTTAAFAAAARAQVPVVGSADFRGAPQLPPGQYRDLLVTGDSAWYALVYTNNTNYRFEVAIDGARPADVNLTASFVAPTLKTIDGPAAIVEGRGLEYPAGHTNVWFLKVTMNTTGQAGVQHPILITIDGVQSEGVDSCADADDCALDDEYAELTAALSDAQEQLAASNPQNSLPAVELELEGLRSSAETGLTTRSRAASRLAQAQASMAELCAPDVTCDEFPDPPPRTPVLGMIIGFLALAVGAAAAFRKLRSVTDDGNEVEDVETAMFANDSK